jgi:TATA-box binding protein (TBP) (component of TFIID and TFIIIB)
VSLYEEKKIFNGECFAIGGAKKKFKNCVIIKFKFESDTKKRTVSLNVFHSGCFHVAGTRCEEEITSIIEFVCGHFLAHNIIDADNIELDVKTRLINATFSVPLFNIDLSILHGLFKKDNPLFFIKYDSNNHPGVQIKVRVEMVDVSCFIFGSGKAIITGSKNVDQMNYVYQFITKYIDSNFNALCRLKPPVVEHVPQKRGRKRIIRD